MSAKKYAVIIEAGDNGFSAYVPDLPGCIAAAKTEAEVHALIKEAIDFHLEGMKLHGEAIPEPTPLCDYVEAAEPVA